MTSAGPCCRMGPTSCRPCPPRSSACVPEASSSSGGASGLVRILYPRNAGAQLRAASGARATSATSALSSRITQLPMLACNGTERALASIPASMVRARREQPSRLGLPCQIGGAARAQSGPQLTPRLTPTWHPNQRLGGVAKPGRAFARISGSSCFVLSASSGRGSSSGAGSTSDAASDDIRDAVQKSSSALAARQQRPRSLRKIRAQLWLSKKSLQGMTLDKFLRAFLALLRRFRLVTLLGVLALVLVYRGRTPQPRPAATVSYSAFLTAMADRGVTEVRLEPGSSRVWFNVNSPSAASSAASQPGSGGEEGQEAAKRLMSKQSRGHQCWRERVVGDVPALAAVVLPCTKPSYEYTCHRLLHDEAFLLNQLTSTQTPFLAAPRPASDRLSNMLVEAGLLWLALGPLLFVALRMVGGKGGGFKVFGRKRKRRHGRRGGEIGFDDVAGVDAAKAELMELVRCLRGGSSIMASLGAQLPRGVLLVGPPGTGKTLLARALAGEAGVPFFSASGSEFVELFVGRGAARVRELFEAARQAAPAVVFIDEIDAVGSARGRGNNEEREQTLNQLLTELDGFDTRDDGVLLLAATNRIDVLDPALCRAGRISRRVLVPLPDEKGRRDILLVHLRRTACKGGAPGKEAAAAAVAALTPGFSGAELQNVVNEAALLAAREGLGEIGLTHLFQAVQRSRFGIGFGQGGGMMMAIANWIDDRLFKTTPVIRPQ